MKPVQTHGIKAMLNTKRKLISLFGLLVTKQNLVNTFMLDKCSYDTCTDTWNQSNIKY